MGIHELSREECFQVLAGARLARLACVKENQPYIVPVYTAFHRPPDGEPCLYGFTTPGQKVQWMRANPLVCIEVDDIAAYDQWVSVVVIGRYEELPDTLGLDGDWLRSHEAAQIGRDEGHETSERPDQRLLAYKVLQTHAMWWEPGSTAHVHPDTSDSEWLAYIYYRVSIDRITGHRATPDPRMVTPPATPAREEGWLHSLLQFFHRPISR